MVGCRDAIAGGKHVHHGRTDSLCAAYFAPPRLACRRPARAVFSGSQQLCMESRAEPELSSSVQATQRAASSSEAKAAAKSSSVGAVSQEADGKEAHSSEQRQQQGAAKKPRARKRSRKK